MNQLKSNFMAVFDEREGFSARDQVFNIVSHDFSTPTMA
jgi:hypothetical protein